MSCLCPQAGVVQPLMTIVFGNLTTSFTGFANALALGQDPALFRDSLFSQVNQSSLYLVYIGIGTFCTTYIQIFTWTWTGERITRRIREAYLRNVLRQNIGFFDKLGPGEVTTRISSDLNMIQSGISDKVPMGELQASACPAKLGLWGHYPEYMLPLSAAQYLSQFIAGLTIAYVKNWRIALVLSVILPCIMIAGGVMGASESRFKTKVRDDAGYLWVMRKRTPMSPFCCRCLPLSPRAAHWQRKSSRPSEPRGHLAPSTSLSSSIRSRMLKPSSMDVAWLSGLLSVSRSCE